MDTWALSRGLFTALLLGLLIGLERGWSARGERDGSRVAGFRTFGLLGLLGGLAGVLAGLVGAWAGGLVLAGAVAALVAGFARELKQSRRVSATSAIAAVLTLCIGVLAVNGQAVLAAGLAAVVALVLVSRRQLHAWIGTLDEKDVRATARFVILSAVILPLLPNEPLGPLNAWNPRELWLVVVLVAGFSFAGYAASKYFGNRGTLLAAALGGLYSSTGVTAAFAQRLRDRAEAPHMLAAGISLACSIMFARVAVLAAILAPSLLPLLAFVVAPGALVSMLGTLWLIRRARGQTGPAEEGPTARNPFELGPALGFAALVAILALAVRWAELRFGGAGVATLIAISGSFDVDAALVTVGGLPTGTLDTRTAALAIAVPVLLNTLFKAGVVLSLAGWAQGKGAALPLLASAAALVAAGLIAFGG